MVVAYNNPRGNLKAYRKCTVTLRMDFFMDSHRAKATHV